MTETIAQAKPALSSVAKISILGATGSVGVNTLDVIQQHPTKFSVAALTTNTQIDLLYKQCLKFRPKLAVVVDEKLADDFIAKFDHDDFKPELLVGSHGLEVAASLSEVDFVMAAIVGAAGLPATLAAAQAGKRILLANKEALVMSGGLLMKVVRLNDSVLLPIDSEHNAVFQCLPKGDDKCEVEKIILTASGGPFLSRPLNEFENITPDEACAHPNWKMGKKISIDSATMMNTGLAVIEACKLFEINIEDVEVVIHPQSIVHSMVAYPDGSMLAHLAYPDMRVPIAHALAWPQRISSGVSTLDLTKIGALEFSKPDSNRFPCLQLAYNALEAAESATTVLNAANEIAVEAFLNNRIRFTDIPTVIDAALQQIEHEEANDLEVILTKDQQTRVFAKNFIDRSLLRH
ncbi:MAG: 1-deoxy-D-xylulose-5-phosphate reductoisomerase [Gammaproteobacteria bacterium]|nr:1-deoxy-D-xylulose-5-phosphate reductoisomerase [Gammaproteobacteria bacterium]